MAVTVERYQSGVHAGKVRKMTFSCDTDGCDTPQPTDSEIIAEGGLNRMGWLCSGGKHFCPKHNPQEKHSGN